MPETPRPRSTAGSRRDSGFSPVPGGLSLTSAETRRLPNRDGLLISRKNRPRIDGFDYEGRFAYHVTIRTANSRPAFEKREFGTSCIELLQEAASTTRFALNAFCFMPDHVHMLIQGMDEDSELGRLVARFKQKTGFAYKQATGQSLWQVSYFDRALRREDSLQTVADYIFENPVKASLAQTPKEYSLSGGAYFQTQHPEGTPDRGLNPEATGDRAEATVPTTAGNDMAPTTSTFTATNPSPRKEL